MNQTDETYTYWRAAWAPWACLLAGVMNGVSLYQRMEEMNTLSREDIRTALFSAQGWADYLVNEQFRCGINLFSMAMFLGALVVGHLSKNQWQVHRYTAIQMVLLAVLWIGVAIRVPVFSQTGMALVWLAIMGTMVVGSAYGFWKSRSK